MRNSGRIVGVVRCGHQIVEIDTDGLLSGCECADDVLAAVRALLDVTGESGHGVVLWVAKPDRESRTKGA